MIAPTFVFHQHKCVGCDACIVACVNENGQQKYGHWRSIFQYHDENENGVFHNLSMACNHCEEAPCFKQCPSKAIYRVEDGAAVLIDEEKCIGCTYCIWNCPYEAPKFNIKKGIVEKCHFCYHRLDKGLRPSCVEACPTTALDFGEQNSIESSPFISLKNDPKPSFIYQNEKTYSGPQTDPSLTYDLSVLSRKDRFDELELKKEWPLILFTLLIAFLAPLTTFGGRKFDIPDHYFLLAIVFGTLISFIHLGRKVLFWRALLNVKHSRLSREILFFSLFGLSILLDLLIDDFQSHWHLWTLIPLLLTVDHLYQPLQARWKIILHSDQLTLISLSLALFFLDIHLALIIVLAFRLILAFYHLVFQMKKKAFISILFLVRIIFLITCLILTGIELNFIFTFSIFIGSEVLGRILFYKQLSLPNVENKMKKLAAE